MNGQATTIFISFDGLTDRLGQSQIIPYLSGLSQKGYKIHILSLEKKQVFLKQGNLTKDKIEKLGVTWYPLFYTRKPPILSTVYDLFRLYRLFARLHKTESFQLIHCRSYLAAIIGLIAKKKWGVPYLFDIRGFWVDERVEGKIWNTKNPLYKLIFKYFKRLEKKFFFNANHIISLTHNAKKEILSWDFLKNKNIPVTVIPCSTDTALFDPHRFSALDKSNARESLKIPDNSFVLIYLGSLGTWYALDEMLDFFKSLNYFENNSIFLFVTNSNPSLIEESAKRVGISNDFLRIHHSPYKEVPYWIFCADAGINFYKPLYSRIATSPTKQGEILAMDIPIVSDIFTGDSSEVLKKFNAGIVVKDFTKIDFEIGAQKLIKLAQTAGNGSFRKAAIEYYNLKNAVNDYDQVYQSITLKKY